MRLIWQRRVIVSFNISLTIQGTRNFGMFVVLNDVASIPDTRNQLKLDPLYILLYNSVLMIAPIFCLGTFDHDLHADLDYSEPRPSDSRFANLRGMTREQWRERILPLVYLETRLKGFTARRVVPWLVIGAIQSAMILFGQLYLCSFITSTYQSSLASHTVAVYTIVFLTVQTVISIKVYEWTWLYVAAVVLNFGLYFGFVFVWDGFDESSVAYTASYLFVITFACILPIILSDKVSTFLTGATPLLTRWKTPLTSNKQSALHTN
jgi:magnesium-transporting ATPase (P-type)